MANNPYVNKVVFGDNTVMDISGDTATPSDVLKGETFHDKSGASQVGTLSLDEFATIDLLKDTVGWTGKNLIPFPYNNSMGKTVRGVTYTVDSNGVVRSSGTSSQEWANIELSTFVLPAGDYILSGISNGSQSTYRLVVEGISNPSINLYDGETNIHTDTDKTITIIIAVSSSNVDMSNKVFYPMLRKADIADDTYEPYHESVEQCKFDRAEQRVLGAKNFCESKLSSATVNGITVTKNNDGSYTISGTNDGTANSAIRIDQSSASGTDNLKGYHGDYILSLLDANKNYVANTALTVMQNSTWNVPLQAYSANNGVARGSIDKDDCFIYITIPQNADFTTAKTVYPMLRLASDPDDTYVPYAMTNKELTDSLDGWTATSQVANEQVTFTGLDDTQGWGYDPRIWIDDNSTNLNPYCRINSITGAGTANMSITYDTDADNGAYVRLRIIK